MKKLLCFFIFIIFNTSLFAQPIQEFVFFGDSLTDNGNLYNTVKFIPKSPPYYLGRFSNGPVWAEHLNAYFYQRYGIRSQNFAVGGATVIKRSIWDGFLPYYLKLEVNSYLNLSDKTDKDSVLYFIWMGANDYMNEQKQPVDLLVSDVIAETVAQMKVLIERGAKNFVIADLPDISATPYAKAITPEQKSRLAKISQVHHNKLSEAVVQLRKTYPSLRFVYLDGYSIFNDIMSRIDFYNQKYHKNVTNLTDACWTGGYRLKEDAATQHSVSLAIAEQVANSYAKGETPCKNPGEHLFWDSIHPSVDMHEIFSSIVIEILDKELYPK